ncbi:nuclear envelope protein [Scheffersomyces amazonensis]|uniref:nuclear envelope protein n=1 Tax=Scheffersomyces amazonensis TaxID=1078765 RepID=UPI00315DB7F4
MASTTPTVGTYRSYFNKVLKKRLKYVNNISIIVAIIYSLTLQLPYGKFWWNLLFTSFRGPIIFLSLYLIKQSRYKLSVVEYSGHKTLGSQIYYSLFSLNFFKTIIFYLLSSYLLFFIYIFQLPLWSQYYLVSKEYRKKPEINDEWVFYWYYPIILSLLYSSQHLIFQKNRLNFKFGAQNRAKPDDILFSKFPKLIGGSIGLNLIINILSPLIYLILKPIIYKSNILFIIILGLDTSIPSYNLSLKTFISISYLSYHIIFGWELLNHIFNVYATIGCIDGKKLISTYSSDPVNTLLTGLRNVEPEYQLSRLTAFQELAYISSSNDPEALKLRIAIYNARSRRGYIWPAILEECSLVIKETTARINYRSPSDLKVLKQHQLTLKEELRKSSGYSKSGDDSDIFGNSIFVSSNPPTNLNSKTSVKEYIQPQTSKSSSSSSSSSSFEASILGSNLYKILESQVIIPLKSIFNSFLIEDSSSTKKNPLISNVKQFIEKASIIINEYNQKFLSTYVGALFRITLKRDTESRVINAVNFGNAIISISNLLIHSIEDDKNGSITNSHICEILNLLEKPIRASNNYIEFLPASIYFSEYEKSLIKENKKIINNNLIGILHDLTMNEFFQICVKFNYKLNDLVLNARTYKLAKWVIDVAIADQQSQQQKRQRVTP